MKKILFGLVLAGLSSSFAYWLTADAATEGVPLPVTLSAGQNAQEALAKLAGRRALVVTQSGKEYDGIIQEATPKAVLISSLVSKELYSAWVKIDDVEAIVYRTK